MISDESEIKSLQVNNFTVPVEAVEEGEGYQFLASVNVRDSGSGIFLPFFSSKMVRLLTNR